MSAKEYPSVDLAYEFARESYQTALGRMDMMDARIHTLIALATTVSLAVPVAFAGRGLKFASSWVVAAVVCYFAGAVAGFYGRLTGSVVVPDPRNLFEEWLELPESDFKRYFIEYAGVNFVTNSNEVDRKNKWAVIAGSCFAAEAIFLAIWAATGF